MEGLANRFKFDYIIFLFVFYFFVIKKGSHVGSSEYFTTTGDGKILLQFYLIANIRNIYSQGNKIEISIKMYTLSIIYHR